MSDLEKRVEELERAVFEGRMTRPGKGELKFYDQGNKNRGGRGGGGATTDRTPASPTFIPFHLTPPPGADSIMPCVKVSETDFRLDFSPTVGGDGTVNRSIDSFLQAI